MIFRDFQTVDPDSNVNGQVEYMLSSDADGTFSIDLPHQGLLTLTKPLDYETKKSYTLNVIAKDRALQAENRLMATTTLVVNVLDSDDQGPEFVHESYSAKVISRIFIMVKETT